MNHVILIGNLTKDPELRSTPNGVSVCTFTLAVGRYNKDEADFLNIVVWKKQAENAAKYLRKGSQAAVAGRIQIRSYEGNDGTKKYITEIIATEVKFLRSDKQTNTQPTSQATEGVVEIDISSEMPF